MTRQMSTSGSTSSTGLPRWRRVADLVATVVSVAAGGGMIFVLATGQLAGQPKRSRRPEPTVPAQPVSVHGASRVGAPNAKTALIQYFDFECPYCKKFALDILPGLQTKYVDSGRAAFFWRHLPLRNHPFAVSAAQSAVCADRFGRFADAHDILFRSSQLSEALRTLPMTLTVPSAAFEKCRAEFGAAAVAMDQSSANALGIASTPSFLVGRIQDDGTVKVIKALRGVRPIADFEEALESVIKLGSAPASGQSAR